MSPTPTDRTAPIRYVGSTPDDSGFMPDPIASGIPLGPSKSRPRDSDYLRMVRKDFANSELDDAVTVNRLSRAPTPTDDSHGVPDPVSDPSLRKGRGAATPRHFLCGRCGLASRAPDLENHER